MKYIIYEMVQPRQLYQYVTDQKIVKVCALQEVNVFGVETEHDTMLSAILEINKKKDELKHLQLTVLPVISINWHGDII